MYGVAGTCTYCARTLIGRVRVLKVRMKELFVRSTESFLTTISSCNAIEHQTFHHLVLVTCLKLLERITPSHSFRIRGGRDLGGLEKHFTLRRWFFRLRLDKIVPFLGILVIFGSHTEPLNAL